MAVDFSIIDHNTTADRCSIGDICSVRTSVGTVPIPVAGPFRIARITDLTLDQVLKFASSHMDISDPDNPIFVMKRLYMLDKSKMTTPQRNAWDNDRYIETTSNTARKWIKNKVTGNYEG